MSADAAIWVEAGSLVTLQDSGRVGAMRYGVSQSGPMDRLRFRLATAIAGATEVAFEIGLSGARFRACGTVRVALVGPGFVARVDDGNTHTAPVRLTLSDGEQLSLSAGRYGMWAYLAVAGLDPGAPVLGSVATNARTGLGARDFASPFPAIAASPEPAAPFTDPFDDTGPVAVLPGPQGHLFTEDVKDMLTAGDYAITPQVDRMGYRLEGTPLPARTHDIVSDGIVEGAIQVPGNGQPIVLCADRAPTGGYPKIAIVARADRARLVQRRPGEAVCFRWEDEAAARKRWETAMALAVAPSPRIRQDFPPEFLASTNLVDGVWAGPPEEP